MANLKVSEGLTSTSNNEILPHVGTILTYAGTAAPSGWLLCNGSTFDQTLYPELYALLGNSNTLPDLREKYLIGKGSSNLTLNTNTGSNNHTHNYSYAGFTSDYTFPVSQTHSHNLGTYFNTTAVSHYHYANVQPAISVFGTNSASFRSGASQNITYQSHTHTAGGNAGNTNYNDYDQSHAHNGTITRNDASATTHNHTVSTSNTGTISSNTPINNPPTIYLNFIIKAG